MTRMDTCRTTCARGPGALAISLLAALLAVGAARGALADDRPQWGERLTRNMVSSETGLPDSFDPRTGANIAWSVPLGTSTHCTPVVAGGRILIGTNNERPRDPRHEGDRGVLLCLDEKTGALVWQLVVPKLEHDRFLDWPGVGLASPPTVEGDRVWLASNRGAVLCLDLDGQADGNDGPFRDEGRFMAREGQPPLEVTPKDADVIWRYDMVAELGVGLHDEVHGSVLIHGDFVWTPTANGVDSTHRVVSKPDAPSLIVLEKSSGRLVAVDDLGIGPQIVHCTWSSPSVGRVGNRELVFFAGSNAVVYAFEPLRAPPPPGEVLKLRPVWRFDCDPEGPRGDLKKYQGDRAEGPSTIIGMPVLHEGKIYVTSGGDFWHGKTQTWLKCIDASGEGDITSTGFVWSSELTRHCMSTPSLHAGLAFVPDCGRDVHCIDLATGASVWTHRTKGEIWGSALVADGKVYAGTRRGDFWIFAADRDKKVLASTALDSPMSASPVAANGTLYVASMRTLYAVRKGAQSTPAEE